MTATRSRIGVLCGLFLLLFVTIVIARGHREGNDYITFGTLWASGRAASNGLNPYAAYSETYRGLNYTSTGIDGTFPDLNLNPPWTLPTVQGLAHLPLAQFMRVWALISAACCFAGLLLLIYGNPELQGRQVIWFALATPTLSTLISGQVYGWAFLFGTLAWFCYKRDKSLFAGVAIGVVVAIRPTMGFWLLLLLVGRFRRIGAVAIATSVALYILPLTIYGPGIYAQWLEAIANDKHWMNPYNIAIMPTLHRMGYPHVGTAVAVLITVLVCVWAARYKPCFIATGGAALSLGILCAPLAWYHYLLFVAPFLMARRWNVWTMLGACLFLASPFHIPDAAHGEIYLLGTMLILVSFVAKERSPTYELVQMPFTIADP